MYIMNGKTFNIEFKLHKRDQIEAACAVVKNPFVFELSDLKMNELVKIYNKHAAAKLKKFSSKVEAFDRLERVLADVPVWVNDEVKQIEVKEQPKTDRSNAIAKSWQDPITAARRAERNGVKVAGEEYRSVRAAFLTLGLPDTKHIAFRAKLKAAGKATFEHEGNKFNFSIVQK